MTDEKRFAVLVDSENVSSKYIDYIIDEMSEFGVISYKRIYGDWTQPISTGWRKIVVEYAFSPMQQYAYTYGKNSTDSAMIIDAMDILYSGNIEGFCLVSSDSDFTKLAIRLRESGMMVIGMGEQKTPKAFTNACNVFKFLDILAEEDMKNTSKEEPKETEINITGLSIIEDAVKRILTDRAEEGSINMGELGNILIKRYPDFDVRNYGYSKLSKLLGKVKGIQLEGDYIAYEGDGKKLSLEKMESEAIKFVKSSGGKINIGTLAQKIKTNYPSFNVRDYGYTKFLRFVENVDSLCIITPDEEGSVKLVEFKKGECN